MTLLAHHVRTARTTKRCMHCLYNIQPGQRYNDDRFAMDGEAYAFHSHPFCDWLAVKLEMEDPHDGGISRGDLRWYWRGWVIPATTPMVRAWVEVFHLVSWWAEWKLSLVGGEETGT